MERRSESGRILQNVRVLIIEDDFFLADDLAFSVMQAGGIVQGPFAEVTMAASVIDEQPCAIAVLDIKLGRQTIFPFAAALQSRAIPFVFATGFDPVIIPARMRAAPVWQKPYSPAFLVSGLSAMLDLRRQPRWP